MTRTKPAAHVELPARLTAPVTPARADVLPPVCRTCGNTRVVTVTPINTNGAVWGSGQPVTKPCPAC